MPDLDLGPAIEAGARAAYSAATFHTAPWDDLAPAARKTWLRESRIHIEAALPELRKAIAEEQDVGIIALTMTPDAGAAFLAALMHAAARTKDDDRAEWLQWGASRLDAAIVRGQSETAGPGFSGTGARDRVSESETARSDVDGGGSDV